MNTIYDEIRTAPQFMVWFLNWSQTGDNLRVRQFENGEKVLYAYDNTGFLCAEFSTKYGLKIYK